MKAWAALLLFAGMPAMAAAPKADAIAAYRALVVQDARLANIGFRLSSANAPFCVNKARNPGWVLHDERQYPDLNIARTVFVFRQPVSIAALVPGSPAQRTGLAVGDGLYAIGKVTPMAYGTEPKRHEPGIERLENVKKSLATAAAQNGVLPLVMTTDNGNKMVSLDLPLTCASDFWVDTLSGRDAGADGESVRITSGMMAYLTDDAELAAVVAHELSHNLLQHRARLITAKAAKGPQRKPSLRLLDTEIEADKLSVWLMANAGYDPQASIRFWQRYGPSYGSEIFMGGHLRWRQRVVLLQNEIVQMQQAPRVNGLSPPPLLVSPQ